MHQLYQQNFLKAGTDAEPEPAQYLVKLHDSSCRSLNIIAVV